MSGTFRFALWRFGFDLSRDYDPIRRRHRCGDQKRVLGDLFDLNVSEIGRIAMHEDMRDVSAGDRLAQNHQISDFLLLTQSANGPGGERHLIEDNPRHFIMFCAAIWRSQAQNCGIRSTG